MQRENIRKMMQSVNLICQAYELTAKKLGIKDEMLSLLYALDDEKVYTQSDVCKLWNIPKTTINAVVQECQDRGLVRLEANPLNRKEKYIRITEYGKLYSGELLKPLYDLEEKVYATSGMTDAHVAKLAEFSEGLERDTREYFRSLTEKAQQNALTLVENDGSDKYLKEVEKLYYDAFPVAERVDFKFFKNRMENFELFTFLSEGQFVGFAFAVNYGDILYLFYFAMNSKSRGKGFGSQALELIKRKKQGKTILLDIEVEQDGLENSLQRIKRKKFYHRAGFSETTVHYVKNDNEFEILCYGNMVNKAKIDEFWDDMDAELCSQYYR